MPLLARLALAAATLFCLIGAPVQAQGTGATATASITGTVACRQRIALPPGASLQVGLGDVTRQDAPAPVVSEMKFPISGRQVPLPFQLPYSQADIDPAHRYSVRADRVDSIAGTFRMSGEFTYMADAGFLTECRSGLRLPVAQEKNNAALERGYGAARSAPGVPLLVTMDGRLARRWKMEGSGEEDSPLPGG